MREYRITKKVHAVIWKEGVEIPKAHTVVFERQPHFPPHALAVIEGNYQVIFEGTVILYANGPVGIPTGVMSPMEFDMNNDQLSEEDYLQNRIQILLEYGEVYIDRLDLGNTFAHIVTSAPYGEAITLDWQENGVWIRMGGMRMVAAINFND